MIALVAKIQGVVRLKVTVRGGRVRAVESVAEANLQLVNSAKANVMTWRFQESVNAVIPVTFEYVIVPSRSEAVQNPEVRIRLPTFVQVCAPAVHVKPTALY